MGIFLILIIIIVAVILKSNHQNNDNGSAINSSSPATDNIDKNFAHAALNFFNGYLSLCKSHHVIGHAYFQETSADNNLRKSDFLIGCEIFTIDDEHACDVFEVQKLMIRSGQAQIEQQINDFSEQILKSEKLRDDRMRAFFDCDDLFYPFCEIEEYEFHDPEVLIQCNYSIFTSFGFSKDETFKYVKCELLKMCPEAEISIGKSGMILRV